MTAKRKFTRRRPSADQLSIGELAWLRGDPVDDLTDWEEFDFWLLDHGEPSTHKCRTITPAELLETYGHLCPPARKKELQKMIKGFAEGREVVSGGKLIKIQYKSKKPDSIIPNNVHRLT
ncbi:MAG: hypothetical protein JXA04_10655 [Gammaproteobacteria bacterium]|nr:hypothetical protein [Gammaproteobacteria bacterium]